MAIGDFPEIGGPKYYNIAFVLNRATSKNKA